MIPTSNEHPLRRDGTSQDRRAPPALDPARRLLDDRGLDELLLQFRQMAGYLVYIDPANQSGGTWEPFFDPHFAVRLAMLAHDDVGILRARTEGLLAILKEGPADQRLKSAQQLHQVCAEEIQRVGRLLDSLHTTPFGVSFERSVFSLLRPVLLRLIAVVGAAAVDKRDRWLDPLRQSLQNKLWRIEIGAISPAADVSTKPFEDALGQALCSLAEQLANFQARVAEDAAALLESPILQDGQQPPHLGLLLAWLRLFDHAQDALNDLVRRHLEFYYACQLRIPPQPAVPDRALVLVEPARNTSEHLLKQNTRLHAGKDGKKAEMQFALVRSLLVNRAAVVELRSTFVDRTAHGLIRAASVANSADGEGEALPKDSPSWHPFGQSSLPAGRWGLALAAPVLRLTGGTKHITVSLHLTVAARDTLLDRCIKAAPDGAPGTTTHDEWPLDGLFTIAITASKAWWSPNSANVQIRFAPEASTPVLRIKISGLAVDEIVSGYSAADHGRAYDTSWPVIELTRNAPTVAQPGDLLDHLELAGVSIECQVTGDTHLVAANDYGSLDPSRPFQPFGASPTAKSSFYVGSAEILSKHLTALTLTPQWKDLPANLTTHFSDYGSSPQFLLTPTYLSDGTWRALPNSDTFNLNASSWTIDSVDLDGIPAAPDLEPFTTLNGDLLRGFVRLMLTSPSFAFGHQDYGRLVANRIVTAVSTVTVVSAKIKTTPILPNPPLSPSLLSLEASYTAMESRDLSADKSETDTLALFYIEPHGEWEITTAKPACLPSPPANGAFYLGIDDLQGGQELALLFYLADGSGNPYENYPEITWEYLVDDAWVALSSAALVADSTNNLRRTGVIVFGVPEDATTEQTRMPSGLVWLRATATGAVSALNRAYEVTAQAGEAVFAPQNNDLSRLSQPLPKASITRLTTSEPAIKKVQQPLPSFGGRPAESGQQYYRRVSERLRHRQRAIDLWDYEHLLLEAFPELCKVKCIPHTSPESELAPGHVTLVVIPKVTGDAYDPLRPAASQDLLAKVGNFVKPLISPHVQIDVVNPSYEEIQVEAILVLPARFTDTGHYEKQATEDLTALLSPWVSGAQQALIFDSGLYPSTILNFLEERDYVDYVADFHVRQFVGSTAGALDPAMLAPTTERSLLVSSATHNLTVRRAKS